MIGVGCGGENAEDTGSCRPPGAAATGFDPNSGGTLTVGSDIPYPPFEDGSGGNYTGFDIDLVDAIGDKLGLNVRYEPIAFDSLLCELVRGKVDMVASALPITGADRRAIAFSDPYYEAQQALVVVAGSSIRKLSDLSGATIGVQDGTTGASIAKRQTDASRVRSFPEASDAIDALRGGQVDAVLIDQPVAHDAIVNGRAGLTVARVIPTGELYGLAVAKHSTELLGAIDKALDQLKQDGTLSTLYSRYFGISPPQAVLRATGARN